MWLRCTLLICDNWTLLGHNPVTKEFDILPTCSVTNSKALSNIWLPYKEVTAIKRNRPSRTGVGISVRGMGNINSDNAMRELERNPVSLVSLTLTILQKKNKNHFILIILNPYFIIVIFLQSNSLLH